MISHTATARRALRRVPASGIIACSPYCATPTTLLDALADVADDLTRPTLMAGLLFGDLTVYQAVARGSLAFRTWHVPTPARPLAQEGLVDYVPMRAGDVETKAFARLDAALVRITPPDSRGNVSLGPSASYSRAMLDHAAIRIAEVDPSLPRTVGADVTYPFDAFDVVVESQAPMAFHKTAFPSELSRRVARNVITLIPDGATVQLGIGAVAEAIAEELMQTSVSGLRLVGMITDRMVPLITSGRVMPGPSGVNAVELLGSDVLFDWAHDNPQLRMSSSRTVHHPVWLSQQENLMSICSALEVDSTGQVVSEQIGSRLIAGIGGVTDFFEGAHLANGGLRIVALTSTTARGTNRIGTTLREGTPVSIPRHSVDVVATENGVAHLVGLSVAERTAALLELMSVPSAAPTEIRA